MKKIVLLLLVTAIVATAHSQSIKGKVVSLDDNTPLAGATMTLISLKDTTVRFNEVADKSGVFQFRNLPVDSFFLKIGYIDYDPYNQIVATSRDNPVTDLGLLSIPKKSTVLTDVIVVSKTPPVQQKGDTTQFNANQYKVNPDATTEDLIKKMPGVTVAKDGTVTAQGEQVKKVTVDGRDFFGDDATATLRNLPAEIVDKIQVFDRLSDQAQFTGFDDGNSQKSINIVTKSGIKNGQFGRIYAGYGTDDTYSAGGNVSFFKGNRRLSFVGNFNNINQQNFATQDLLGVTSSGGGGRGFGGGNFGGGGGNRGGGGFGGFGGNNFSVGQQSGISKTNAIGINYGDKWGKKMDVTGSYFFNNSNTNNDQETQIQTLLFNGKTQYQDQSSLSKSNNYNHRMNMRLNYTIDSSNSLIISPSLNFQNYKSMSNSFSRAYYGAGDSVNRSNSNTDANRNGYNIRNNILFRHSFAKRGRTFSVNLGTTFNENNSESYTKSEYVFFDPVTQATTDSMPDQYATNPTNGYTISANFAYTEPIGKKGQLQFNYSPSYSKSKANQQTFMYDPTDKEYSQFDTTLSNKFDNTTTTHRAGISYRLGASRDNQLAVGADLQYSKLESERIFPTTTQVDQSFTTVLPNLMWRKKISAKSSLNIFYRANTNFPSVTQLQDVVDVSNPLRVSSGNPDLKQSFTNFLSFRYIFTNTKNGQSFFANIFAQTAQNYISSATYIPTKDSVIQQGVEVKAGSQFTKPVNLNGYKSFRSFFTYSQPVKFIKSNINLTAGLTYSALPGMIDYQNTMTKNYVYNGGAVVASNISEYVDFNISYNASLDKIKDQPTNDLFSQTAGLQLTLLSKSGWFFQNDVNNQSYNYKDTNSTDQNFWLWNMSIGKKFLKKKQAELKFSVFDLLKQNQSITRTVTENTITNAQSVVLRQYFMLTFTYSLKNFGTAAAPSRGRGGFGGPGGPPFGGFGR